ncbi:MAG TPA: nucleotidyltransferase family protein [Bacteroidota bacterium]|nr:nucleotidyltransferase family protein [Bacteroidota bacterium]
MTSGIILAAGASFRMGSPKALLNAGQKTFLGHIGSLLANSGIVDIIVVLGADAETIRGSITTFPGTVVVNEHWTNGQLSSLRAGLDVAVQHSADHILVWPVDRPLVRQQTLTSIIAASAANSSSMIVPTCRNRRGHPVIFPENYFGALRDAPLDTGARYVVRKYADAVFEFETEDEGILLNIDTPETYHQIAARFFQNPSGKSSP